MDPEKLPMPIRHGIALAMKAKGSTTFWGTSTEDIVTSQTTEEQLMMMGGCRPCNIKEAIREEMQSLPIEITAREYVQYKVVEGEQGSLPNPEK